MRPATSGCLAAKSVLGPAPQIERTRFHEFRRICGQIRPNHHLVGSCIQYSQQAARVHCWAQRHLCMRGWIYRTTCPWMAVADDRKFVKPLSLVVDNPFT